MAFLGFEGSNCPGSLEGGKDCVGGGDEFSDSFFWETPAFVSLDDLIFSAEKYDDLPTMDVPPPPKVFFTLHFFCRILNCPFTQELEIYRIFDLVVILNVCTPDEFVRGCWVPPFVPVWGVLRFVENILFSLSSCNII